MASITDIAIHADHKHLFKLEQYFAVYDKYFSTYRDTNRNKPVRILEIGVFDGGSLDLWRMYFGEQAVIFGLDINPDVQRFAGGNTHIVICDQEDRDALEARFKDEPPFDIILDDGGHMPNQQIRSFEALFPLLHPNGVYIVEDVQTSYWKSFHGGLRLANTFIEFSKYVLDYVNVDHFRSEDTYPLYPPLKESLCKQLTGVHFYDGMVAFVKGDKTRKNAIHYYGKSHIGIQCIKDWN